MTGINRIAKGAEVERKAIAWLEDAGYKVHRCVRHVVRSKGRIFVASNDIFGAIDLVAKKQGQPTLWVQVTCSRNLGDKVANILTVPWTSGVDSVEVWRWVGGEGPTTDRRSGKPRDRLYFQRYLLDENFACYTRNRIFIGAKPAPQTQPIAPVTAARGTASAPNNLTA